MTLRAVARAWLSARGLEVPWSRDEATFKRAARLLPKTMCLVGGHQQSLPGGHDTLITPASLLPIVVKALTLSSAATLCHWPLALPDPIGKPTSIASPTSPLPTTRAKAELLQVAGAPPLTRFLMPQRREDRLALSGNVVEEWEEGVGRRHMINARQHSYLNELLDSFFYITPETLGISVSDNICSHWVPVVPRIRNPLMCTLQLPIPSSHPKII